MNISLIKNKVTLNSLTDFRSDWMKPFLFLQSVHCECLGGGVLAPTMGMRDEKGQQVMSEISVWNIVISLI